MNIKRKLTIRQEIFKFFLLFIIAPILFVCHSVGFADTPARIDDPYQLFTNDLVGKVTRLNENHPIILKSVGANDFSDMDKLRDRIWQNTEINDKDNAIIILVSINRVNGKKFGLCTGPNLDGERILNTFKEYKDELASGDAVKISQAISQSLDKIKDYPNADKRDDKLFKIALLAIILYLLLCGTWFILSDQFSRPRLIVFFQHVRQFDELYKYWETSGISSAIPSLVHVKWFQDNWLFDNVIARDMWQTVMTTSQMQKASPYNRLRAYRIFVKRNLVFDFETIVSPNLRQNMFKRWSNDKSVNFSLRMKDYKSWCNAHSIIDFDKNYCGYKDAYMKTSDGHYTNGDVVITSAIYDTLSYEHDGSELSDSDYLSDRDYSDDRDYSSSRDSSGGDYGGGSF